MTTVNKRIAWPVPLVLVVATLLAGCVEVNGGAVEIRWDIRDLGGARVGCEGDGEDPGARQLLKLSKLYFQLELKDAISGQDTCLEQGETCRFECTTGSNEILSGSTPFSIPEGRYLMTSYAVGQPQGAEPRRLGVSDRVVAPYPVLRQVAEGEVTDLNVNLIIVQY